MPYMETVGTGKCGQAYQKKGTLCDWLSAQLAFSGPKLDWKWGQVLVKLLLI